MAASFVSPCHCPGETIETEGTREGGGGESWGRRKEVPRRTQGLRGHTSVAVVLQRRSARTCLQGHRWPLSPLAA